MMAIYFAFGSNMDARQMARRCPGARSLGLASLAQHRLVFRGPSKNRGGGVASVDPWSEGSVEGLLWEISAQDIQTLDRVEGAPHWYERVEVEVVSSGGTKEAALLYRLPTSVTEMEPTDAYYAQIVAACDSLGLDASPVADARARGRAAEQRG